MNTNGDDQTVQLCRLIYVFAVYIWHDQLSHDVAPMCPTPEFLSVIKRAILEQLKAITD